ncbi:thioesterase II family protein [Streptomyces sp. NPDC054794]
MTTSVPSATAPGTNPWLRPLTHSPRPRMRLLCFHPAGAGPNFYRAWAARLPQDVEVLAVHLPGREGRFAEPRLTDYHAAVAALYAGVRPALGPLPYAFFGHSMGALLAYGVALTAARHGDPAPERLLLSGCAGPGGPHPKSGRGQWSDADIVEDLRAMGGTTDEVLASPELMDILLPVLRADYTLCDSFHAAPPTGRLGCPLTVLGGADDRHTPDDLARWAAVSTGAFAHHTFPGGHFFLTRESTDPVLSTVTAVLSGQPPCR